MFNNQVLNRSPSPVYDVGNLHSGKYFFNLFHQSIRDNCFCGYLNKIPITVSHCGVEFNTSPVYRHNSEVLDSLLRDTDSRFLADCLKPTSASQSNNYAILSLAKRLTRHIAKPYNRVAAVHNWVAENISYDMDTYLSGSYPRDTSALGTLRSMKSVCQGYSDLSVALLRAAGVPAMGLSCFAINNYADQKWESSNIKSRDTNHRITLAFVDNRWLITDITWDSDNEFRDGKFQKKTGMGVKHKYFDITLPMLSYTHRLER
jgi:transglutaminase/protease-like cytokinesis protein 3